MGAADEELGRVVELGFHRRGVGHRRVVGRLPGAAHRGVGCHALARAPNHAGERVPWILDRSALLGDRRALDDAHADQLPHQGFLVGEVAVDGSDAYTGQPGDVVDLRRLAVLAHDLPCRADDLLAVAAGVGAQRPLCGGGRGGC